MTSQERLVTRGCGPCNTNPLTYLRAAQDKVQEDPSAMMGAEDNGELEFDCCIGTSYHTEKMR